MTKTIALLGATGSIGRQTLEVVREQGISVAALTAHTQIDLLERQARQFMPRLAVLYDENAALALKKRLRGTGIEVMAGEEGLLAAAAMSEADTVVTAVMGSVGLRPTLAAIQKGKRIALANKETLVCAGELVMDAAEKYGADVHRAEVAGLLHDCTKKLSMPEQLALCEKYGIALDELEKKALKLLHAKTGAALARDVFGVDDEIYNAILWHTTGKPDMTVLEKVIYLADFIEPTRDFPGVDALRRTVWEDLDRGLLMGLEMTVEEMEEMGNPIHVNTLAARDYLKGKTNEGKAGSGQQL